MSNSFFISLLRLFLFLFIVIFVLCSFFIPFLSSNAFNSNNPNDSYSFIFSSEYLWPTPGYTSINSPFGKRTSPTAGASSFHKGIDIGAPEGSKFIAITSGKITFTGFLGGGGYTITLTNENMKITYCHVSPNYLVHKGDIVKKGDILRTCWTKKCIWC